MTDAIRTAKERYQQLHEGLPADRVASIEYDVPRGVRPVGRVADILYVKETTRGTEAFQHDYAKGAQQRIGVDPDGRLVFYTGKSVVTTRGIEDLPAGLRSADRLPPSPKVLTALGVLEKIVFANAQGGGSNSFGNPVLAHDEHGNLHALYNSKSPAKGSTKMARRNPSMSEMQEAALLMLQTSLVIGGAAALTNIGANVALAQFPTLTAPQRAGIKIGGGVVGGMAVAMLGGELTKGQSEDVKRVVAQLAAGVAVGGAAAGFQELWALYVAPMLVAAPAQQAPPQQGSTGAYLPAGRAAGRGFPAGYRVVDPAACAAGYR